ncbi:MAG: patatin-like phospholipase family protein [Verrucomicrobia bacterium]|nr:patatin-like phospholipase family protein [Verrucomicrobiota bacterium]
MQELQEADHDQPRRILSLDGGGLRVFFTLEVLERVEQLVRRRLGRDEAVLAEYFDLIAGTSTGAILGALLAWGKSIAWIKNLYAEMAVSVFRPYRNPLQWWRHRYDANALSNVLRNFFVEEGPHGRREATLGSPLLRTLFLAVLRNASTGSAWPLCSHPALKYNARDHPSCNLDIPLWRIVRASAAAPTFFAPERIRTGEESFQFVDGGVTPYNNPALIAALMVTEPCFNIRWPGGEDRLYVLSVGTGRTRVRYASTGSLLELALPTVISRTITALIEGSTQQQDLLCRVMGRCLHGPEIDSEVGQLIEPVPAATGQPASHRRFTYVRYNTDFSSAEFAPVLHKYGGDVPMNLTSLIPALQRLGERYATSEVREEHLR